jgi:ferredoxin-like protein FixX
MLNAVFINITFDAERIKPEIARALVTVCPVNIFGVSNEQLAVRPEELDECTLCEMCLVTAPAGALVIHKLYKDEQLISHGVANS